MALPPEPIDEILPQAQAAVIAHIKAVLHRDEQVFVPNPEDPDVVDIPRDLPAQRLSVEIKEVLFGQNLSVGQTIEVLKPAGDYVLRVDIEGPLLLSWDEPNAPPTILGRYGPDTYSKNVLQAAIQKHQR